MYAGAQSDCIDGAGHMLHFEAPVPLASSIERFLQQTL